jgi:ribosomal protein S14
MLSSKIKDLKNRKFFLKTENNKLVYKFIYTNTLNNPLFYQLKQLFFIKFFKKFNKIRYKSSTRVLNKCVLSNRNQKTFAKLKLSRLVAKDLLSFGLIPGYKKAVW